MSDNCYEMPFTRVEVAVLRLVQERLCVLLIKREDAPYKGRWALPGGVIRIDLDRDLEEAAQRIANERLGVQLPFLRQMGAVGSRSRDPRGKWSVAVIYRALVVIGQIHLVAGKRIKDLAWVPATDLASHTPLAFDHLELVDQALEQTHRQIDNLDFPAGYLPEKFTLSELQKLCEQLRGARIDKSSFRRKLRERDLVEPVEGEFEGGANRPAAIYRLRPS
jgi:ADP-ribose pyrophosphatase YjhB (NUDIX family)